MPSVRPLVGLALILSASHLYADDLPPASKAPVDFARDIQPILAKACYRCHGEKAIKGGLALDARESALKGGDNGPAILPGKSDKSRLIRFVSGIDDDIVMPPLGSGEMLTDQQVGVLRAWIDQGAQWPDALAGKPRSKSTHWAFQKPVRPKPPTVSQPNWLRNPIDAFVLARLDREKLTPAPEAPKETLLRRLSLDLIGLPPTPEEIDAFLLDNRPDAYEKQVDRLLNSPHYGERWARRWLDRARYADTNGYEKDRERSIWPYRDWVIKALNNDMPFDQFSIEQLAGDLLPNATTDQKIATGFHRNTMINEEGGIDVEEFRFASVVDRIATTGGAWMGLTLQCAQCHTHKYDPITQREYYKLFAFFNNVDELDIDVTARDIEARRAQAEAQARSIEATRASQFPPVDPNENILTLKPKKLKAEEPTKLALGNDGLIVASGKVRPTDTYIFDVEIPAGIYEAFRIDTSATGKKGPGRTTHGNFVLTDVKIALNTKDKPQSLPFRAAKADVEQVEFPAAAAIDADPKTGWAIDDGKGKIRSPHFVTFAFKDLLKLDAKQLITITLEQAYGADHTLGQFKLSLLKKPEPAPKPESSSESELRASHLARKFKAWQKEQIAHDWTILKPIKSSSLKHATMDHRPDGSILARGDKPNNDVYEIGLTDDVVGATALRLEVLPDPSLPDDGPGRAPLFSVGDFILTDFIVTQVGPEGAKGDKLVAIATASEDYSEAGHPAALAIDPATDTGWTVKGQIGKPHAAVFEFKEPLSKPRRGSRYRVTLRQEGIHQMTIGRFRISATKDKSPILACSAPADIESLLNISLDKRSSDQQAKIREYFLSVAPELDEVNRKIANIRRGAPKHPTSMVMVERPTSELRSTHIHKRGEFQQPLEIVQAGVPAFLPALPSDAKVDRLAFAQWLMSPENPLPARVFVNQAWQAFFGRGIVATVDDFGVRGDRPTHPELLDWLATEAVKLGWSQKALHRLIVTSSTYRQSSKATAAMLSKDPLNELLARGPRVRVEAEMVRDIALRVSGLLNPAIGGPGVYPPQPDGVMALSYGQMGWPTSTGPNRYRRGMYTFIKRTAPYATFVLFDGPTSDIACIRRERSNTPLQALTLLNDPVYQEAAGALADRLLKEAPKSVDDRIRHAYRIVLGRHPSPHESAMIATFYNQQLDRAQKGELGNKPKSGKGPGLDPEKQAWTAVARALLNLDETITKE
jgi:hypothetical protein